MIRLTLYAVVLAGFAIPLRSTAFAADLDHRHALPAYEPYRPADQPLEDEETREHLYTRPVLGFYGYPNDYLPPAPRYSSRSGPHGLEPYILRRDAPHEIRGD